MYFLQIWLNCDTDTNNDYHFGTEAVYLYVLLIIFSSAFKISNTHSLNRGLPLMPMLGFIVARVVTGYGANTFFTIQVICTNFVVKF
jgi:hypothetical protein